MNIWWAKRLTTSSRMQPLKELFLLSFLAAALSWLTTNSHQFNFFTLERSTNGGEHLGLIPKLVGRHRKVDTAIISQDLRISSFATLLLLILFTISSIFGADPRTMQRRQAHIWLRRPCLAAKISETDCAVTEILHLPGRTSSDVSASKHSTVSQFANAAGMVGHSILRSPPKSTSRIIFFWVQSFLHKAW